MALVGDPPHGKRPHVKTEKMIEFIKAQEEQHKNFSCPFDGCTKVLTSYPGLKYHMKGHQKEHDEYICDKCSRSFKSANGLRYHCSKSKCEDVRRTGSVSDEEFESSHTVVPVHGVSLVKEEMSELSFKEQRKVPPALLDLSLPKSNLNELESGSRLQEFAIFATGPQSPLMQQTPIKPWEIPSGLGTSNMKQEDDQSRNDIKMEIEDNNRTDKNGNYYADSDDMMVSSTSQILPQTGVWSHQWPKPVWQCFISGTKVCIGFVQWEDVESLALQETIAQQAAGLSGHNSESYQAPNGLRLLEIRHMGNLDNNTNSLVHMYFTSDISSQLDLCAECSLDHPFFVKGKGWCSNDPVLTERHYGIPCLRLQINDICLPPISEFSTSPSPSHNITNYDQFSPMDRSAVYTLSTMAQKSSPKKSIKSPQSSQSSPTKKRLKLDQPKAKRPMNAFMLFAKDHREEYTQKYPGKDNRAISVLLGDEWQKLDLDCRHAYAEKAKLISEQQKKIHPDCWKRKK